MPVKKKKKISTVPLDTKLNTQERKAITLIFLNYILNSIYVENLLSNLRVSLLTFSHPTLILFHHHDASFKNEEPSDFFCVVGGFFLCSEGFYFFLT